MNVLAVLGALSPAALAAMLWSAALGPMLGGAAALIAPRGLRAWLAAAGAVIGLLAALASAMHAHLFAASRDGTGLADGPFETGLAVLAAAGGVLGVGFLFGREAEGERGGARAGAAGLLIGFAILAALSDRLIYLAGAIGAAEILAVSLAARPVRAEAARARLDRFLAAGMNAGLLAFAAAFVPFTPAKDAAAPLALGLAALALLAAARGGLVFGAGDAPDSAADPIALWADGLRRLILTAGLVRVLAELGAVEGDGADAVRLGLGAIAALGAGLSAFKAATTRDGLRLMTLLAASEIGLLATAGAFGSRFGDEAAIFDLVHLAALLIGGRFLLLRLGRGGDCSFASLAGGGRRAPWSGAALVVMGASLVGAPLTLGFLARWRLIDAALDAQANWAAAMIGVVTALMLTAMGRLIEKTSLSGEAPPATGAYASPVAAERLAEIIGGATALFLLWAGLSGGVLAPVATRMAALFAGGLSAPIEPSRAAGPVFPSAAHEPGEGAKSPPAVTERR